MHNVHDYNVLYNSAVRLVISEGCHFAHMWKAHSEPGHFTKKEVWVYKTSLKPPIIIEVPVPSRESERSRVLGVSILLIFEIFLVNFGAVPTEWYFLFFALSSYYRILRDRFLHSIKIEDKDIFPLVLRYLPPFHFASFQKRQNVLHLWKISRSSLRTHVRTC
jgi:hypothetical protein